MTLDELRAACERAGLRYYSTPGPHWKVQGNHTALRPDDPWLLSYVASLLVAEVREGDEFMGDMEYRLLIEHPDQVLMAATDQQRIRAAMAVLSPAPPAGTGG